MAEIRMVISGVELAELEEALADLEGIDFEEQIGHLDPLTVAVVVGAAYAGSKLVLRLMNEVRGGTVIDVTKDPIHIERDSDLPYGFFVIRAEDGTVSVEAKDEPKDAVERMIGGALELAASSTADAATSAIEVALGPGAETKRQTPPS